jgi:hypothetical protein
MICGNAEPCWQVARSSAPKIPLNLEELCPVHRGFSR